MHENRYFSNVMVLFRPPANAATLGSRLLGYRLTFRDLLCNEPCSNTVTISSPVVTHARLEYLSNYISGWLPSIIFSAEPATTYKLTILAFTRKREGISSGPVTVTLDTAAPDPPLITLANCTGRWSYSVKYYNKDINIITNLVA